MGGNKLQNVAVRKLQNVAGADGRFACNKAGAMTIFAERLRALIDLRKSQKRYRSRNEMARAMGLDTGRFGHYATAEREPDIATILLICHELRTHPNYLLGFSDDPDGRYPEEDTRIGDLAKEIRELKLLVKRTRRERD